MGRRDDRNLEAPANFVAQRNRERARQRQEAAYSPEAHASLRREADREGSTSAAGYAASLIVLFFVFLFLAPHAWPLLLLLLAGALTLTWLLRWQRSAQLDADITSGSFFQQEGLIRTKHETDSDGRNDYLLFVNETRLTVSKDVYEAAHGMHYGVVEYTRHARKIIALREKDGPIRYRIGE